MAYNTVIESEGGRLILIVETSVFTRQMQRLLTDDEYRQLQVTLVKHPYLGAIIVGSGGIRKARWAARGHGKSGGVRVIYYWATAQGQLLLLLIYAKGEQENLSPAQVQTLRKIVEEEYP